MKLKNSLPAGGGANCVKIDDERNICLRQGYHSHFINSGYGYNGWIKFCEISINHVYQNSPIIFDISQRGLSSLGKISLLFTNTKFVYNVSVQSFIKNRYILDAVICPVENTEQHSVFSIYILKTEPYDSISIACNKSFYLSFLEITWKDEYVDSIQNIPNIENGTYAKLEEMSASQFHGIADNAYGFYDHSGVHSDYITKSYIGGGREANPDWFVSVRRHDDIKEWQLKAVSVDDMCGILGVPSLITSAVYDVLFNISSIAKTAASTYVSGINMIDIPEFTGLKETKTIFIMFENESIYKLDYDGTVNGYPSLAWTSIIKTKPEEITLNTQSVGYGVVQTNGSGKNFSIKYLC